MVALTIIAIGIASMAMGMSQLNKEASISRNVTGAGAILQNQIDLILADGPFNPQKMNEDGVSPQIPPELCIPQLGICRHNHTPPVLQADGKTWKQAPLDVAVYRDPARWTYANAAARTGATGFSANDIGQLGYQSDTQTYWRLQTTAPTWIQDSTEGIIVKGTVTTSVEDVSQPYLTVPLYIYRATVTVKYKYRGKDYSVSRDTLRTSDI